MNTHLTEEQARTLREVLQGHHLEAIITLALVTGMRRDELLHVTWQDIDLEKQKLRVLHSKTKRSYRMVCIPEDVTEKLKQHAVRQMEARLEAGTAWHDLDLVFADREGEILRTADLLKEWYGILDCAALPHLRFHDLRSAVWRAQRLGERTPNEGLDGTQARSLEIDKNIYPS